MSATSSTRKSTGRSPVTSARVRASREALKSLCSAPFNWETKNSVVENGCWMPKTTDAHFLRNLFSKRSWKTGYSPATRGIHLEAVHRCRTKHSTLQQERRATRSFLCRLTRAQELRPLDLHLHCTCQAQRHTQPGTVPAPHPDEHKDVVGAVLKINVELATCLRPTYNTNKYAWQQFWLEKENTQWKSNQKPTRFFRNKYG